MFATELFGVETNPAKSQNLGVLFDKISPSAHMYQPSAADAFTKSRICGGSAADPRFAPLSFVPDKEEFILIWVQFHFIF